MKNISEIKLEWKSSVYFADDEENCRMLAAKQKRKMKNRMRLKLKLYTLSGLFCLFFILNRPLYSNILSFSLVHSEQTKVNSSCNPWITIIIITFNKRFY